MHVHVKNQEDASEVVASDRRASFDEEEEKVVARSVVAKQFTGFLRI